MAVRGKSGKIYADAVRGKSVSELFRMGYTSAEVDDIKRRRRHRQNWRRHYLLPLNAKRSMLYCVVAIMALYTGAAIYNGVQENNAAQTVNAHSRATIGYDALVEKGVLGHAWTAFTNPNLNFSSLSRGMETRVSYAAYEAYGVWDLNDYRAINADSPMLSQGASDTVDVMIDNYIYHSYSKGSGIEPITHNQYHKEVYTSLVKISFETDFLIARGLRNGDTYKLTVNMRYQNNDNEVHMSRDAIVHVIVGESTGTTITAEEPDCYITVNDIVGFDFE